MAVRIDGVYQGNLKLELTHGPSGKRITTAAPVDNRGDGSSFSPTDLCAAALGSCMLTTMAIYARDHDIPFDDARFSLEKHMRADPRRIDRLPVTIHMPSGLERAQRTALENVARSCPVYRSLLPDIEKPITFVYPDT